MAEERKAYGIQKLRDTWTVAEATAKSMRGNRSKETGPERALRLALWHAGLRGYRKNVRGLPGTPDVVFRRAKLAVFVHGCFWHACPHCGRHVVPKQNRAYWQAKFAQNAERDARHRSKLAEMGFTVLVVWECEVQRDLPGVVDRVRAAISAGILDPSVRA